MGYNWSSIYYANYDLSGYQLVSPIVGLLAYNADEDANSSNPFQLGIVAGEKPMTIDFTNATKMNQEDGIKPLCASFEGDGRMKLAKAPNPSTALVCVAKRHGHFGMIVEYSPPDQFRNKPLSRWKVAVGSTIGAALGAFLLGLLLVAMLVRVKKRSRMVEMERRAYEEEALQVSMVGHVRAPTALGTRTTPIIEHEATVKEANTLHNVLETFEASSGLVVNFQKFEIFGRNTQQPIKEQFSQQLGVSKCLGKGRYLGMPSMKKANFGYLRDKIWKKD
ncbi:uncharacterized protein [Glycine max]|uniref:uncharacterized protein n=1 Tax=Glycine max TaxID=3847 RepID=UPI00071912A3|nr:uncharacterized protein LOC100809552 [Glycine max]|eukprot:XP_014632595.1 uncharacterized protein LOC100809552 [Glycine max]